MGYFLRWCSRWVNRRSFFAPSTRETASRRAILGLWTTVYMWRSCGRRLKAGGCPQSASRRAAALEPHPDTEFAGGRCVCPRYIAGRRFEPTRLFGGAELFAFSAEGQTPRTVSGTSNQPHGRIPFRSRHVVHPES